MQNISEEIATDHNFNIVNILLIDHSYLKKCISIIVDPRFDKHQKLFYARSFLETLKKHNIAEEKTVYDSMADMDEFRKDILEGEIEHGIARFKFNTLIPRLSLLKELDEVSEVELKVLAEFVREHIDDEEQKLFPKMKQNIDSAILNEMGFQFMILRKHSPQELNDHPELQKQIHQWSGNFVKKVNSYISSIISYSQCFKSFILFSATMVSLTTLNSCSREIPPPTTPAQPPTVEPAKTPPQERSTK